MRPMIFAPILVLVALPGCLGITTTVNTGEGDTKGIDAGDIAVDPEAVQDAVEEPGAPALVPTPAPAPPQ